MTDEEALKTLDEILANATPEQIAEAEEIDLADLFAKADEIMANPIYDDKASGYVWTTAPLASDSTPN